MCDEPVDPAKRREVPEAQTAADLEADAEDLEIFREMRKLSLRASKQSLERLIRPAS
jgi:hypothetical protein